VAREKCDGHGMHGWREKAPLAPSLVEQFEVSLVFTGPSAVSAWRTDCTVLGVGNELLCGPHPCAN